MPYARTLSRPARVATQSTLTPGEDPKGFSESEPEEVRSGPGIYLAHNSAKLKIFNLPTSIQLLRCGPLRGLDGTLWIPSPAIRWSVGSEPAVRFARIRGAMSIDTKTTARFRRAAVSTALALELVGLHAPIFICFQVPARPAVRPPGSPRVVETRRLELLTLSLQRRCSAN